MTQDRARRKTRRTAALVTATLILVAGCSSTEASQHGNVPVTALKIEAPVREPVWSRDRDVLLALTESEPRIAKIEPIHRVPGAPTTAPTTLSRRFSEVGENIETSPTKRDVVYLPQPKTGRVAVVGIENLQLRRTLRVGPAPSYVAKDSGSVALLALSEDGSTVTGYDLQHSRLLPSHEVGAGPEAEIDGPKRGRLVSFHVVGPEGVSHYKGPPGGVSEKGHLDIPVEKSAGDLVKETRVYIAEKDTDRLVAVDSHRWHHGLEVVAEMRVGEPVRHIGVDETRIYAATEHELVVLETNSFEGFDNNTFDVVDTIDYRAALPGERLEKAPLSGLAVGDDHVYLTLKGEPYVVSVGKPAL